MGVQSLRGRTRGAVALLMAALFLTSCAEPGVPEETTPPLKRSSARVESLLAEMTLQEKLGQLHQAAGGRSKSLNSRLNEDELDRVRRGGVGSYLHVAGAEPLGELQRVAVEESRLGIPLLFAMDVVHGYKTIFPVPLALASTWDPAAWEEAARISANEATAAGLHWTFAPMIDIARDPRWGRVVEGAGADPYLGSRMAEAQVVGYQGASLLDQDTMLATAKHLGAYGAPLGGRDYGSAELTEQTLYEVYLPPFYAATEAGVATMMTAFNDIGGRPTTANETLIDGSLRGDWGFDGMIVSDWNAIAELQNHGVAGDRPTAGALALKAGVDMDMTSEVFVTDLAAALEQDPQLEADLDLAVARILTAKERLGLFDDPYAYHSVDREGEVILADEHRAAARRLAHRSMVLLKNESAALPIEDGGTLAVLGGLATDTLTQLGSWRAQGDAEDVVSLLEGLEAGAPEGMSVVYAEGAKPQTDDLSGIAQAVAVARSADHVLLVIGEDFDQSGEARSQADIALPASQLALAEAVFALDKPVTVLLVTGRPLAIPQLDEQADAILLIWMLGVEAGHAVADVVFGDVSPAGRLPISFPRHSAQVPLTYSEPPSGRPASPDLSTDTNRFVDLPITPLYPFGHGLSYADFSYGELRAATNAMAASGEVTLSVDVTNISSRESDEVVQLYMRDPVASRARPALELRGFERLRLAPQETKIVSFTVKAAQSALFQSPGRWAIEPGRLEFHVGRSSADLKASVLVEVTGAADASVPAASIATRTNVQ